jgi:hypothetical protein
MNDDGPVSFRIPQPAAGRLLKRCHDEGLEANDTVTKLVVRQLERPGSLLGFEKRDWREAAARLRKLARESLGLVAKEND